MLDTSLGKVNWTNILYRVLVKAARSTLYTMRECHPRRSSPRLRPFVCNSGSSFDRTLLHAFDRLYERRCHPTPVGRAFDFIACRSAIATHVATTMSAFVSHPRTHTRQSFRLLCTYTRGSDFSCSQSREAYCRNYIPMPV